MEPKLSEEIVRLTSFLMFLGKDREIKVLNTLMAFCAVHKIETLSDAEKFIQEHFGKEILKVYSETR